MTILGSQGPDRIEGTDGPDVIDGQGGNDMINGLSGDDVICGGIGNDWIKGGDGTDVLRGDRGADFLEGSTVDRLGGGGGIDACLPTTKGGSCEGPFVYYGNYVTRASTDDAWVLTTRGIDCYNVTNTACRDGDFRLGGKRYEGFTFSNSASRPLFPEDSATLSFGFSKEFRNTKYKWATLRVGQPDGVEPGFAPTFEVILDGARTEYSADVQEGEVIDLRILIAGVSTLDLRVSGYYCMWKYDCALTIAGPYFFRNSHVGQPRPVG